MHEKEFYLRMCHLILFKRKQSFGHFCTLFVDVHPSSSGVGPSSNTDNVSRLHVSAFVVFSNGDRRLDLESCIQSSLKLDKSLQEGTSEQRTKRRADCNGSNLFFIKGNWKQ